MLAYILLLWKYGYMNVSLHIASMENMVTWMLAYIFLLWKYGYMNASLHIASMENTVT